jgi:hypothetical protein
MQTRTRILKSLDCEIQAQQAEYESDREADEIESAPDVTIFPSDAVLDQIVKYRTANEREFLRNRSTFPYSLEHAQFEGICGAILSETG